MKQFLENIIIIILMFMFINATHTYFHESIHVDICNNFGGTSSIEYSFAMQGGKTLCTTSDGTTYHIINDIISYTVSILVLTIFMCILFFIVFFEKQHHTSEIKKKLAIIDLRKRQYSSQS
ncbi:MAG: hypothetical protein GQ477_03405 [Nanohaloarchaea archaeon]|nr:hypothetical protein [Candidatus Nanohaloarchaea archaeon]